MNVTGRLEWGLLATAVTALLAGSWSGAPSAAGRLQASFYDGYSDALEIYVDERGLVDYAGLKNDRSKLDQFTDRLARIDESTYRGLEDHDKVAFWINAYNALTLRAIIDHYPIRSSKIRSLIYPENSIRQIAGVWDELEFTVMKEPITLDEIEHEVLRKEFDEPRIHMALVCASIGCPALRREPYIGKRLESQLDDQTRRFLSEPRNFTIDREDDVVRLSSIFEWFTNDFAGHSDVQPVSTKLSRGERAVMGFLSRYLEDDDRNYVIGATYSAAYLPYDWSLNDRGAAGAAEAR